MWVDARHQETDIRINTEFIALFRPEHNTVVLSSGNELMLSPEDYTFIEQKMFPKRKSYTKDDTELASFLNELHRLTGGKNTAILTPERRTKLEKLFRSMTREQLVTAATNIGKDKWLQGDNEKRKRWGDIDFLLRPDKAAKYAEISPEDKRRKMF